MNCTVSLATQYQPSEIMQEIQLKMNYKGYEVITSDDKSLIFNGNTGEINRRSILWFVRFYEGKFEITDQGDQRLVRLKYQVFSVFDVILMPIIIGFPLAIGIEKNESWGYIAASVLFATILLNIIMLYFTAKNMLKDILF